jgi:hypothetical protein
MDGVHKFVDILKSLVHRGITQIRHFIDPTQFLKHLAADDRRGNLTPACFQFMHNFVYYFFQGEKARGPFFKGFGDAAGQFSPIEWLVRSVTFHDAEIGALDFFIGGKAVFAF